MPEISRFFGIVIQMFINEHNPPHFHAFYGEKVGMFKISNGEMIKGNLPKNKVVLVTAWCEIHREQLLENWNKLDNGLKISKIKPLK